jgi:hypothetical protein
MVRLTWLRRKRDEPVVIQLTLDEVHLRAEQTIHYVRSVIKDIEWAGPSNPLLPGASDDPLVTELARLRGKLKESIDQVERELNRSVGEDIRRRRAPRREAAGG